jgi:hypothetical protein
MSVTRRDVAGVLGAAVATLVFFRTKEAKASKCGNIDAAVGSVNAALSSCSNAADDYGGKKAQAVAALKNALSLLQACQTQPQCVQH